MRLSIILISLLLASCSKTEEAAIELQKQCATPLSITIFDNQIYSGWSITCPEYSTTPEHP